MTTSFPAFNRKDSELTQVRSGNTIPASSAAGYWFSAKHN